jgi:hypothetical protein
MNDYFLYINDKRTNNYFLYVNYERMTTSPTAGLHCDLLPASTVYVLGAARYQAH